MKNGELNWKRVAAVSAFGICVLEMIRAAFCMLFLGNVNIFSTDFLSDIALEYNCFVVVDLLFIVTFKLSIKKSRPEWIEKEDIELFTVMCGGVRFVAALLFNGIMALLRGSSDVGWMGAMFFVGLFVCYLFAEFIVISPLFMWTLTGFNSGFGRLMFKMERVTEGEVSERLLFVQRICFTAFWFAVVFWLFAFRLPTYSSGGAISPFFEKGALFFAFTAMIVSSVCAAVGVLKIHKYEKTKLTD